MKSSIKNIMFIAGTIFLILFSTFFITKTVRGQVDENTIANENFLRVQEQEYVHEIRNYLNERGFENSGVTLTRIVDEQGNRNYQVMIHHEYLERMQTEERENIFEEIKALAFEGDGYIFRIKLLV